MQKLTKTGELIPSFAMQLADKAVAAPDVEDQSQVSVPHLSHFHDWSGASQKTSVWLDSDDDPSSLINALSELQTIAIHFPAFADGRCFSIARTLRQEYGYQGEICAVGEYMQDQLHYLKRCGFDSFAVNDDANLDSMKQSLADFSDHYQGSSDNAKPLFRRRS